MKHRVLDLKPTQFAVGMLEVEEKIALVEPMTKKQRHAYIDENPVPVVVGPHGDLYVVDHHHFLTVCYHCGIKRVRVEVVEDLSRRRMSYRAFWKWMASSRNTYPFCQFGEGPREALYLPKDVRGLADDPYRSLAWYVRKAGAFEPSDKNFAEFRWANFFRSKKLLDRHGPLGMPRALVRAVALAQSKAAKDLPGFGQLNLGERAVVVKKIRKRGAKLRERAEADLERARLAATA